jgi:hypothetical protein
MRLALALITVLYSTAAMAQGTTQGAAPGTTTTPEPPTATAPSTQNTAPPTIGGKKLVQVKPHAKAKLSIAARLQACLDIEAQSESKARAARRGLPFHQGGRRAARLLQRFCGEDSEILMATNDFSVIPGPRHPSRLVPTWSTKLAKLGVNPSLAGVSGMTERTCGLTSARFGSAR